MAKYTYTVNIARKVTFYGDFLVESETKLTEEEVLDIAIQMAREEEEPDSEWEESGTEYDDPEITDGEDDLKNE